MTQYEFERKRQLCYDEINKQKALIAEIEHKFALSCLAEAGFHIGDILERNGFRGIITDAEIRGSQPCFVVKKIKADGTPSMVKLWQLCGSIYDRTLSPIIK